MKILAYLIATMNCIVNSVALFYVVMSLLFSELFHLNELSMMINPTIDWIVNNPDTKLFAYEAPAIFRIEVVTVIICIILTTLYLRIKKSQMEASDLEYYESYNVIYTKINMASLIDIFFVNILSFMLYETVPMSIVFIVLFIVIYKFIPTEKLLYLLGFGK